MPNDDGNSGWTTERIIAVLGALFAGLSMLVSTWNNTKLNAVHENQVVNAQKIDVAADKAVVAADKTADVQKTVDAIERHVKMTGTDRKDPNK